MKKQIKIGNISFSCDILNNEYSVRVCVSDKDFVIKEIEKHFENKTDFKEQNFEMYGLTFMKRGFNPLIWVNTKYCKYLNVYPTLAHESYHAVDFILDFINSNHKDDEVIAHSIGAIIREYNENLKKISHKTMPLKKGKKNIGKNITELNKDNKKKGKSRGANGKPRSKKQILAIALRVAGVKKK